MNVGRYLMQQGGGSSYPSPKRQVPFRPWPTDQGPYTRTLEAIWPDGVPQTRDYLRADAWGVVVPNAPRIPAGSQTHPERIQSYLLSRYLLDVQKQYLNNYAECGYTHLYVGADDSMALGGMNLDQYLGFCRRIRDFGVPYIGHLLCSKYRWGRKISPQEYADAYEPILDALIAAKLIDEVVPAWEMNIVIEPGIDSVIIIKAVGAKVHAYGISNWLHGTIGYMTFHDDTPAGGGGSRYGFWDLIKGFADGVNYQSDSHWSYNEYQGRLMDSLVQQGGGLAGRPVQPWWKIRDFEQDAELEFDGDHPDELDSAQRGYVGLCPDHRLYLHDAGVAGIVQQVWGGGNGQWWPDGRTL